MGKIKGLRRLSYSKAFGGEESPSKASASLRSMSSSTLPYPGSSTQVLVYSFKVAMVLAFSSRHLIASIRLHMTSKQSETHSWELAEAISPILFFSPLPFSLLLQLHSFANSF